MFERKEVIVIGNGFDLSCGLESKYSDFFSHRYPNFNSIEFQSNFKKIEEIGNVLKNILGRNIMINNEIRELKKGLESNLLAGVTNLKIKGLSEELEDNIEKIGRKNKEINTLINKLIHSTELNFWDYAFMFRSNGNEEKILWCNIETEILKILNDIMNSFEKGNKKSLDIMSNGNDLTRLVRIYFNSNKFMTNFEEQLDYDYILNLYKSNNISEILFVELNSFERAFNDYIKKTSLSNRLYVSKARDLFRKISHGSNKSYILNFNYTNPFSESEQSGIYHINNIHGNLNSDEIIFGIDSFDELENSTVIFTKTNRIISLADRNSQPIPIKERTNSISFFGHSLSSADYSYFLSLFDFYDIYNSHVKLRFCYINFNSTAKKDLLQNITSLMTKYGESFDNKAKGRNLMHKLSLENRLIVEEIK